MDSIKRYQGLLIFIASICIVFAIVYYIVAPKITDYVKNNADIEQAQTDKKDVQDRLKRVQDRIRKTKNAIATAQKKIYSPMESDLGNDTLFFTLYNDVVEMLHANSIKIKSIKYVYNPEKDAFVEFGKDVYFVCDVDMDLVGNYVNIGKFIQDIYQYPYYLKINKLEIVPYQKDKKILLATLSLRLYAHTSSDNFAENTETPDETAVNQ